MEVTNQETQKQEIKNKIIFIFSRTKAQAQVCANENDLKDEDWTFIDNVKTLSGVSSECPVWLFGDFYHREDHIHIQGFLNKKGFEMFIKDNYPVCFFSE